MNKSILLIDTPKRCDDCPCGHNSCYAGIWCNLLKRSLPHYGKPEDCPLKALPEKSLTGKSDYYQWGDWEDDWNACIDSLNDK